MGFQGAHFAQQQFSEAHARSNSISPIPPANGAKLEGPMTSEAETKFMKEFGPRRDAMLGRLAEAAGVTQPKPMSLGDLEVLAAASMELLTTALANIPEPRRGELVNGLSATMAADVARKREWLEQRIPGRRLDTPEGSA
jgi:hypothetical protein